MVRYDLIEKIAASPARRYIPREQIDQHQAPLYLNKGQPRRGKDVATFRPAKDKKDLSTLKKLNPAPGSRVIDSKGKEYSYRSGKQIMKDKAEYEEDMGKRSDFNLIDDLIAGAAKNANLHAVEV